MMIVECHGAIYYPGTVCEFPGGLQEVADTVPTGGQWYFSREQPEYEVTIDGKLLRFVIQEPV